LSYSPFCFRFQIAGDNTLDHSKIEPEIGKSGQVVLELADGVPEGSQLYFDNWFASPLLIKKFGEKNIGATSTLRQNRYGTVRVFSTFPPKTKFVPFFDLFLFTYFTQEFLSPLVFL
jgi:hypothetical protein